jgi:hypothetical protein
LIFVRGATRIKKAYFLLKEGPPIGSPLLFVRGATRVKSITGSVSKMPSIFNNVSEVIPITAVLPNIAVLGDASLCVVSGQAPIMTEGRCDFASVMPCPIIMAPRPPDGGISAGAVAGLIFVWGHHTDEAADVRGASAGADPDLGIIFR